MKKCYEDHFLSVPPQKKKKKTENTRALAMLPGAIEKRNRNIFEAFQRNLQKFALSFLLLRGLVT